MPFPARLSVRTTYNSPTSPVVSTSRGFKDEQMRTLYTVNDSSAELTQCTQQYMTIIKTHVLVQLLSGTILNVGKYDLM